jgi:mRNA interferase MazF
MTTTTYDTYDVVEVPFPFSDMPQVKIRKALVLTPKSMNDLNGATTLMMITSRKNSVWTGDTQLTEWSEAGLKKPCFVRLKFFTPDNKLIIKKIGKLSQTDMNLVSKTLLTLIPQAIADK